jgi:hypothetical protein
MLALQSTAAQRWVAFTVPVLVQHELQNQAHPRVF